ncbi:MAG: signal peptide peptidase SppA [Spirochaetes bacterium]|nr:signal peptide peptidase SppA [Spirochaetota bacterium]
MEKERKMLIALLALIAFSVIISLVDISMKMNTSQQKSAINLTQTGPGVGIVRITGAISMNGDQGLLNQISGAEGIIKKLDEYSRNPDIKAIVIRIDSPGGTVGATQEIFNKIMSIRNSTERKVPVIASMGDLAASGGYYAASACDYIFANHGTLTGSIGVIIAAPNFKDLFQKLGIRMNVIKSGRYKDILSSSRELSQDELDLLQDIVDSSYNQFLKDVSLGRNIPIDDIRPYADGRILGGTKAVEVKLVDAIGGFEQAIQKAREMGKLPAGAPVYESTASPFDQFFSGLQGMFKISNPAASFFGSEKYSIVEYRYLP